MSFRIAYREIVCHGHQNEQKNFDFLVVEPSTAWSSYASGKANRKMKSVNGREQHRIPISQLQPSVDAESTSITGVVTLLWPFSASKNSLSLLLVEPDFRLRREKGQVRVTFCGSSAGAVAERGISIGDEVSLSLVGVTWIRDDNISGTPGTGVEWGLQFRERVVLTVCEVTTHQCNY